jgi:hypothetical protein
VNSLLVRRPPLGHLLGLVDQRTNPVPTAWIFTGRYETENQLGSSGRSFVDAFVGLITTGGGPDRRPRHDG